MKKYLFSFDINFYIIKLIEWAFLKVSAVFFSKITSQNFLYEIVAKKSRPFSNKETQTKHLNLTQLTFSHIQIKTTIQLKIDPLFK